MKYPSAAAVLVSASLLVAACGQEGSDPAPEKPADSGLFMDCAESRGSLSEVNAMLAGTKLVDTSTMEHGARMLTRLADRVSAAGEVRSHLERWMQALTKWRDQLRAMPPKIENGLLIEPDTSALDRELVAELQTVSKPLSSWVKETCDGVQL